jgi:hypothetical protein
MIAMGSKDMLQFVVGAGQPRDLVTMKQTGPVAAGHLEKVLNAKG